MADEDFLHVYEENVWRIYGFLAYRLRSRAEAEDLTQLTFERAFAAWGRYDPARGDVSSWLFAIARNALTDHGRRKGARPQASVPLDAVGEGQLPAVEGPEDDLGLDPELAAALERLGHRERSLVALRFGGDLRGPEIAELTGLSLANVHQILSRALRSLRGMLEQERAEAAGEADVSEPARD